MCPAPEQTGDARAEPGMLAAPADSERCESAELDHAIRDLIERRAAPGPRAAPTGATPLHGGSRSLKTPGQTAPPAHPEQGTRRMSAAEGGTEPAECADPSRGKSSTNSLERKIRCLEKQRKELLEVNRQWDQQFRSMKELYAGKLAELQTKLEATERFLGGLEKGRPASPRASAGPADLAQEQQHREEKEKQTLSEELLALKKENKLLKENNAAMSRRREHYECEIKRLNKALQEALKVECSPLPEDRLGGPEAGCGHEDMRTEMEVLKQQVQIYEEDFRRERSDRERLNREKEQLQQMNRTSQSQLNQLKSKVKACRLEQERLERQLEQMRILPCRCGLGLHLPDAGAPADPGAVPDLPRLPPDRQRGAPGRLPPDAQHAAHGFSSEKKGDQ